MEDAITWGKEKDDQLEKLKEVWNATPIEVQRKFLFMYINENYRLYDNPKANINETPKSGTQK